jgi:uncharacterized radical SAM superfamily protein
MGIYNSSNPMPVALVQLPFPSQDDPEPNLAVYYSLYESLYRRLLPQYKTTPSDLWEAPLWVAHLDGALGRDDTSFLDLSLEVPSAEACLDVLREKLTRKTFVLFSPLAQNFTLASQTSRLIRKEGHVSVLGGNMARIAGSADFDVVFIGQAKRGLYEQLVCRESGVVGVWPKPGRQQPERGFRPTYRLLRGFADRVSLVRLNASHGCLFGCTFCGDGWSRQLQVVPHDDLEHEFDEIEATFPRIRTIYVGDKTFGQSREAVENLIRVTTKRRQRYQFIVQTHVLMVDGWLLDALDRLDVSVVEMGFETADEDLLRDVKKQGSTTAFQQALEKLRARGKTVILNVLGGLPTQTEKTHAATIRFLQETADLVYLYNLYNFVPYPETPLFASLKSRIVDWDFSHWREDMPVVFKPYAISRERSWELFLSLIQQCREICEQRESNFHRAASERSSCENLILQN